MRKWWLLVFAAIAIALLWLMRTPSPPSPLHSIAEPRATSAELGEIFDPSRTGTLICQAHWEGDVPEVRPISLVQSRAKPNGQSELPNPNAPRISKDGRLADVIVSLRGIDLRRSAKWTMPPVSVEINTRDLKVRGGANDERFGIARRGEEVSFVSREASSHSIRARGAAFFTQMLFVPDQPVHRRLFDEGIVELTSGTWFWWMRAYLIVSDHPYVGVTGDSGDVRFENVPDGDYELVCWKANWHIAKIERDPEWIFQTGLLFHPPAIKKQRVRVEAGQIQRAAIAFADTDFVSKSP
jgi:hypothetical protein